MALVSLDHRARGDGLNVWVSRPIGNLQVQTLPAPSGSVSSFSHSSRAAHGAHRVLGGLLFAGCTPPRILPRTGGYPRVSRLFTRSLAFSLVVLLRSLRPRQGGASESASVDTLTELTVALAPAPDDADADASASSTCVSVVVCVSARDTLDEVVAGLSTVRGAKYNIRINLWSLHSDMLEREVTSYANEFREVARSKVPGGGCLQHGYGYGDEDGDGRDDGREEGSMASPPLNIINVLVTTDSPLKTLSKLNSDPLAPSLLIHYTLPRRREEYSRRKSVVLGNRKSSSNPRVAVCFVHAGRLDELHEFERMSDRSLLEMPVRVKDILRS